MNYFIIRCFVNGRVEVYPVEALNFMIALTEGAALYNLSEMSIISIEKVDRGEFEKIADYCPMRVSYKWR